MEAQVTTMDKYFCLLRAWRSPEQGLGAMNQQCAHGRTAWEGNPTCYLWHLISILHLSLPGSQGQQGGSLC